MAEAAVKEEDKVIHTVENPKVKKFGKPKEPTINVNVLIALFAGICLFTLGYSYGSSVHNERQFTEEEISKIIDFQEMTAGDEIVVVKDRQGRLLMGINEK